jgi:hypothetical protein
MKQTAASTLSQHLLREADRFLFYPQQTRRTRINLAAQKMLNASLRRLVEWRKRADLLFHYAKLPVGSRLVPATE